MHAALSHSLSRLVSLSLARSCTIVYTMSQYGRVAKPPPSISRPFPTLATDPPDVAFRHITKRQKPVCGSGRREARGISHPMRFYLSAGLHPSPHAAPLCRGRCCPAFLLPFSLFFVVASSPCPCPMRAISLVDRNIFRCYKDWRW